MIESQEHSSAAAVAQRFSSGQRRLALTVVALAFVMDLLDSTIVNVAIPSMQTSLGFASVTTQWVVAGYYLTFAILLTTGGRLGDVFGYRRLFLVGVAGFTLASVLCGATSVPLLLIAGRLIQGAMAALMVPQVTSLIQILYAPAERMKAMGVFGILGGLSAVLGPVIGGLIIHANLFGLHWRPIFLINVPVGIIALVGGYIALPGGKSGHPLRIDLQGILYLSAALLLLLVPLIEGRELHWPAWMAIAPVVAILPAFAFIRHIKKRSLKDGSALVVPELFHIRSFSYGLLASVLFRITMAGYFLIFSLLLQLGFGYSALRTSLVGIPFAIGVSGCLSLVSRRGLMAGRYLIAGGAAIVGFGICSMALATFLSRGDPGSALLLPIQLATGFGMGCLLGPSSALTLSEVDVRHAGSASGVMGAIEQFGAAIGVALIGTVFLNAVDDGAAAFTSVSALYARAFYLCVPVEVLALAGTVMLALKLPDDPVKAGPMESELMFD
jgi:EmrB/QacA subfamily drug resistance transporter